MALAWAYGRFGTLSALAGVLYGVKPVMVAVVAQALWSLGKSALKTGPLRLVALAALGLSLLDLNELLVLLGFSLQRGGKLL